MCDFLLAVVLIKKRFVKPSMIQLMEKLPKQIRVNMVRALGIEYAGMVSGRDA